MNRTPMELLNQFAPEFGQNQIQEKSLIFENEKYQKVPNKYKMLIGIGVAEALRSDTCTKMWTNMEKQNSEQMKKLLNQ